jgi:DnaJ-class molecular chaperone
MTEQRDQMKPGDEVPPGTNSAGPNLCPKCSGSGEIDGERCESCLGTGQVEEPVGGG